MPTSLVGPLVKGLIYIGPYTKQPTSFLLFPQRMQVREYSMLLNLTLQSFLGIGKDEHVREWTLIVSGSGERLHVLMKMD